MTCSGRLEMDSHGVVIDLIGADPRILAELLADLEAHRRGGADDQDRAAVSRVYGKDGVAARDPRTGAAMARPKDVRKGELDPSSTPGGHVQNLRQAPSLTGQNESDVAPAHDSGVGFPSHGSGTWEEAMKRREFVSTSARRRARPRVW